MIEKLMSPPVAAVDSFVDPQDAFLMGEEVEMVWQAAEKRRREFTTARWCARRALALLDIPPMPILRGERGAPRWPEGTVGSLTHCDGYRAAAVARATEVLSIGIDAEPHLPLPGTVLDAIALPSEAGRMAGLRAKDPALCWDRLLFSTKESVYKAWFPLTGRWLGFDQADITLHSDETFHAKLLAPAPEVPGGEFTGRWAVTDGLIATAIVVPRAR
ncbi:4'-phosphopantetheinyl transferase superfamily protein [Streptomyces sp. NPDC000609]|uniref:4'-phosphopantetheinyl transferase family protein n=1 Tax=Streptomyces sp. NPDC000609 TaxID=3160957 RepID=UPI003397D960